MPATSDAVPLLGNIFKFQTKASKPNIVCVCVSHKKHLVLCRYFLIYLFLCVLAIVYIFITSKNYRDNAADAEHIFAIDNQDSLFCK